MNKRIEQVRREMEKEGLDGVLIESRPNTFYYTGFTGSTSKCLVTKESATLVVDFRYTAQARQQVYSGVEAVEFVKGAAETLHQLCVQYGVKRLGIEEERITLAQYNFLQEKLEQVTSFENFQSSLNRVRWIKDQDELQRIQKAVDIADKAFEDILSYIKPGVREVEIALEMEYRMKKLGAQGVSFETIIASGPRSALPHGVAGMRKLQKGDAIVMDFGAIYQGYCSDMTRTVFLGDPPQKLKEIYDIVLRAQMEALKKAVVDMKGSELDKVSRDIICAAGYEKCFGHSLGHGVGIEVHEMPSVSPKGEDPLREGMVFSVEPGIYVEDLGGVRIEDLVYMGDRGVEILTKSTKDRIVL